MESRRFLACSQHEHADEVSIMFVNERSHDTVLRSAIAVLMLIGGHALLYSLPIRRLLTLTQNRIHHRPPPRAISLTCNKHIFSYASRGYHARTRAVLSGAESDDCFNSSNTHSRQGARQMRIERLHHHLSELGVDAEMLADAAFRSVTTTGNKHLHTLLSHFPLYGTL